MLYETEQVWRNLNDYYIYNPTVRKVASLKAQGIDPCNEIGDNIETDVNLLEEHLEDFEALEDLEFNYRVEGYVIFSYGGYIETDWVEIDFDDFEELKQVLIENYSSTSPEICYIAFVPYNGYKKGVVVEKKLAKRKKVEFEGIIEAPLPDWFKNLPKYVIKGIAKLFQKRVKSLYSLYQSARRRFLKLKTKEAQKILCVTGAIFDDMEWFDFLEWFVNYLKKKKRFPKKKTIINYLYDEHGVEKDCARNLYRLIVYNPLFFVEPTTVDYVKFAIGKGKKAKTIHTVLKRQGVKLRLSDVKIIIDLIKINPSFIDRTYIPFRNAFSIYSALFIKKKGISYVKRLKYGDKWIVTAKALNLLRFPAKIEMKKKYQRYNIGISRTMFDRIRASYFKGEVKKVRDIVKKFKLDRVLARKIYKLLVNDPFFDVPDKVKDYVYKLVQGGYSITRIYKELKKHSDPDYHLRKQRALALANYMKQEFEKRVKKYAGRR